MYIWVVTIPHNEKAVSIQVMAIDEIAWVFLYMSRIRLAMLAPTPMLSTACRYQLTLYSAH